MILFKAEAIFASSILKFGKSLPAIDRDDIPKSSMVGHQRQQISDAMFWIKEVEMVDSMDELKSTGIKQLMVDGFLANVGIGTVLPIGSSCLATSLLVLMSAGTSPVALGVING